MQWMHKDKSVRKYEREVKIHRMLWQFLKGPQIFLVLLPSWDVVYDLEPEYGINHIMYLLRLSRKWLCSFYLICWNNCSWSPDLTWKKSEYPEAMMFWGIKNHMESPAPALWVTPSYCIVPQLRSQISLNKHSYLCSAVSEFLTHTMLLFLSFGVCFLFLFLFFNIAGGNWNRCD